MGQRANLIIPRSDNGYDLYYNHWCANTLPIDLFWGPEYAEAFIRKQVQVDQSGWLNDIWAEGGVVMDADRRVLLFYGGEDIRDDIPLRKHYLGLMRKVWAGWELKWADDGIADLAAYVGFPVEKVIASEEDDRTDLSLAPPQQLDWTDTVGSIRFEDGELLLFPLTGGVESYLQEGPNMLHSVRRSYGYPEFDLTEWTEDFPTDGFHIDVSARTVDLWHAGVYTKLTNRLQSKWLGWRVIDHHTGYEKQLEYTKDKLKLPIRASQSYLFTLSRMLLKDRSNPLNSLTDIIETLTQKGEEVKVSPWAFAHHQDPLPIDVRKGILRKAINATDQSLL
ncbi:hypothetical protein GE107_16300 [Cohnella sp. CFH 77786]|uniref:hypothetical protein n=1 Tax=Cohnella sp. CFH 77786 TaxID=2662265 RepID=UPI001C609F4D|nr:hypothetical protein [Cohnella sp. CFH 77786]MBW5447620.1 hypothetical protein [Cohnella sp. CFH 77786]